MRQRAPSTTRPRAPHESLADTSRSRHGSESRELADAEEKEWDAEQRCHGTQWQLRWWHRRARHEIGGDQQCRPNERRPGDDRAMSSYPEGTHDVWHHEADEPN